MFFCHSFHFTIRPSPSRTENETELKKNASVAKWKRMPTLPDEKNVFQSAPVGLTRWFDIAAVLLIALVSSQ